MKLVQLLAKELKEWPENIEFLAQDSSGGVFGWIGRPEYYDDQWIMNGGCDIVGLDVVAIDLSDDYKSSLATKSQWQAEREKMNKPKWIRHRGGNQPVEDSVKVEYRMRDGDISTQPEYAATLRWSHWPREGDIMAYRVIEETKDQEIEEVKKQILARSPTSWRLTQQMRTRRLIALSQNGARSNPRLNGETKSSSLKHTRKNFDANGKS